MKHMILRKKCTCWCVQYYISSDYDHIFKYIRNKTTIVSDKDFNVKVMN